MATIKTKCLPKKETGFLLSQYLDFKNPRYRGNGCGIISLLVAMRYFRGDRENWEEDLPSPDELYEIGLERGVHVEEVGWSHFGLAELAKLYGFDRSQNFDWAKEKPRAALLKLKRELKNGPVLASVFSQYKIGNGGHLVVLCSLDSEKAVIWDPDTRDRVKIKKTMSVGKFLKAWKKRIIVIR